MSSHGSTYQWHKDQSDHNKDTQKYLAQETPHYIDWEINTIFYSSCKLVDAYLIKHGFGKPPDHIHRRRMVRRELNPIRGAYKKLELLSKQSRYDGPVNQQNVNTAITWHTIIIGYINSNY